MDHVSAGALRVVLGAVLLGRYGPAGVNPEGSCRKDQRARNCDPLGRVTASGMPCLKERRLRVGEGRMIIFLKYAKDCCWESRKKLFSLVESKRNNGFKLQQGWPKLGIMKKLSKQKKSETLGRTVWWNTDPTGGLYKQVKQFVLLGKGKEQMNLGGLS